MAQGPLRQARVADAEIVLRIFEPKITYFNPNALL
jgi:hypothetical protein